MSVFSRIIAKYKYKKAIKKSCMQLAECLDLYQRNEVSIKEVKQLMEMDKRLRVANYKPMTNKERI